MQHEHCQRQWRPNDFSPNCPLDSWGFVNLCCKWIADFSSEVGMRSFRRRATAPKTTKQLQAARLAERRKQAQRDQLRGVLNAAFARAPEAPND